MQFFEVPFLTYVLVLTEYLTVKFAEILFNPCTFRLFFSSCFSLAPIRPVLSSTTTLNMNTELQLDAMIIRKGKNILRAINHPLRQQMLHLLHKHGSLIVTDIYHNLEIEQSVASQHLAILRQASIVNAKRSGKQVYYSVNHQRIQHIQSLGLQLLS